MKNLFNRIVLTVSAITGKTARRAISIKIRMSAILRMSVRDPRCLHPLKRDPRIPEHSHDFRPVGVRIGFNVLAGLDSLCNRRRNHDNHLMYAAPKARSDSQIGALLASLCSEVKNTTGQMPGDSDMYSISTGSRITAVHHAMICSLRSFASIFVTLPLRVIYDLTCDYLYFINRVTS